jgi:hypothetical protein
MFLKKSDMKIKSDGLPDNNAKTIQAVHVSSKHFTFFWKKTLHILGADSHLGQGFSLITFQIMKFFFYIEEK